MFHLLFWHEGRSFCHWTVANTGASEAVPTVLAAEFWKWEISQRVARNDRQPHQTLQLYHGHFVACDCKIRRTAPLNMSESPFTVYMFWVRLDAGANESKHSGIVSLRAAEMCTSGALCLHCQSNNDVKMHNSNVVDVDVMHIAWTGFALWVSYECKSRQAKNKCETGICSNVCKIRLQRH